jgi:tetratricopeptide (TPR) repeat protein
LCLSSADDSAWAQTAATTAASNPEYQALFKRMYDNPQDMEATFRFAEVATRLGDYDAAIGALERVLFYNPDLARVKVELGSLYQRIGGAQMARSYLEQAIATPGAAPDVQTAAQQLLLAGDNPTGSPNKFSFFVNTGMRYQTNANAGPNSSLIRSFGDVTALNNQFGKAPDWNHFILTNAGYSHDLGAGVAAEFYFFGYYAKQVSLSRFDTGIAELHVGPRFTLPSELVSNFSVKFYGIGTASWLAEDPYYGGPGAGISSRFSIGNALRLEPSYEYRDRAFKNSELYPTVSEQSSKLQVAGLTGDGTVFGLSWTARLAAGWNRTDNAAFDFNSYDRLTAEIGFPMPFSLTWGETKHQFVFTPTAGFSQTDFLQPNPTIDPAVTRADKEWRVGAALDIQVYGSWGIRTHLQYAETLSNLPNFEMKNLSVSFGPTYRF